MAHRGNLGATAGLDKSPRRRARDARRRRAQEKVWRDKCGPVTVRFVDPAEFQDQSRAAGDA